MAQDISITYNSSNPMVNGSPVFPDCNSSCLSQYHYLVVSPSPSIPNSFTYFRVYTDSSFNFVAFFVNTDTISSLDFPSGRSFDRLVFASGDSLSSLSLTFTLKESLSSVSGTLNISQNGTYDVSSYATAEVDVPAVPGDYHDDLQQGITAIYVLGGVMLVIYFFYCIYRMIIKNVGES